MWYNVRGAVVQCAWYCGAMCMVLWCNVRGTVVQCALYCGLWCNVHGTVDSGAMCTVLWCNVHGTVVRCARYCGLWCNIHGTEVQCARSNIKIRRQRSFLLREEWVHWDSKLQFEVAQNSIP